MRSNGIFLLEDTDSYNGVFINGEPIDGLERVDLAVVAEDVELVTGHATVRVG